ncbi:MAG TPA: peptidyl-prolyl cis-trans isomerase [Terriglobales bacterium]|nr:peptidyl-prolyl cis-trans isomerase [Terriglobales bacterium]
MTRRLTIWLVVLGVVGPVWGQLAVSHSTAALAKPASQPAVSEPAARPVARVNGSVLTDRDLRREMYTIFPYAGQHNGGFPKAMEADIRAGALKMIVFEELVYQEARRRGMTVPAAKMDRAVTEFRKQFKTPDDYRAFMSTECNNSQKVLRARIERSLLIEQLLNAEISSRSAVSPSQVKAYYDKNLNQFRIPETYSIQTISILPPQNATPSQVKEARKRAEDALNQAKATKNYEEFGVLAEKISEDDYRVMMGDRHAVDKSKLPAQVLQAVQAMQPGQTSSLVAIENGYTIIRLNAHNPAGTEKFEQVKDTLHKQLKQQKSEQLRSALDKKLRARAKIEEL